MWSSDDEQNKSFSQVLTTEQSALRSSDLKSSSTNQNVILGQNDLKWFLIKLDILHVQQNVKVKKN
jgi:flagellar hook-basal body complex protein FliE